MTEERFERKELERKETKEIQRHEYDNLINSCGFFRRLGGIERLEREYTDHGYLVTRLTSISPDKLTRVVRTFKFD